MRYFAHLELICEPHALMKYETKLNFLDWGNPGIIETTLRPQFDSAETVCGYILSESAKGNWPLQPPVPGMVGTYNNLFHRVKRDIFVKLSTDSKALTTVLEAMKKENIPVPKELVSVSILPSEYGVFDTSLYDCEYDW